MKVLVTETFLWYATIFMVLNIFFQIFFFFISSLMYKSNLNKSNKIQNLLKFLSIISIITSFFMVLFSFYYYLISFYKLSASKRFTKNISTFWLDFDFYNIPLVMDLFGFLIMLISFIVGFLSLKALDNRLFWKQTKYFYYFNIFTSITYFFSLTQNLMLLFILYECFLLPSFILVYYISPNKRALQASIYFILWTQIGSFFVASAIFYIVSKTNSFVFSEIKLYKFSIKEVWSLYFILFIGFGVKVPIWPFHYWLTKTHVEAPAGFSMFLSGFLVKTAIFCFYKISNLLHLEINTYFFISITLFGIIDASLKMWSQTDLKKLVAYSTIQEMNLIYLTFLLGDSHFILGGLFFCFTHSILSCLMFYLVDCIQRRFHTRSVLELSGILHTTPNLGLAIFIMCLFFFGLPGTLKFTSEFIIFSHLIELDNFNFFILIICTNFFGVIGFAKCWFNCLFGMNPKTFRYLPVDLTLKESLIINICNFLLIFPNLFLLII